MWVSLLILHGGDWYTIQAPLKDGDPQSQLPGMLASDGIYMRHFPGIVLSQKELLHPNFWAFHEESFPPMTSQYRSSNPQSLDLNLGHLWRNHQHFCMGSREAWAMPHHISKSGSAQSSAASLTWPALLPMPPPDHPPLATLHFWIVLQESRPMPTV